MIVFTTKPIVLVVDDAPENIDVLNGLLKDQYQIKVALDGKKALAIASSQNAPDLILLDIMMPGMDGFEVCRQLKGDPDTKGIPVLFLSAKVETEDMVKGFQLGAVDYVTKPFNTEELLARVRTHLEHQYLYKQVSNMKTALEESDNVKSQIILTLTNKIIPYAMEVLQANMRFKKILTGSDLQQCVEIITDGKQVMNLLRRVEALLKS
ncbi:MAG: response regulator [Candidatus Marinimicrobia bacterium]|nr:response regulator [Candidatus Neomarinimicrobiota bacterium]